MAVPPVKATVMVLPALGLPMKVTLKALASSGSVIVAGTATLVSSSSSNRTAAVALSVSTPPSSLAWRLNPGVAKATFSISALVSPSSTLVGLMVSVAVCTVSVPWPVKRMVGVAVSRSLAVTPAPVAVSV